MDSDSFLLQPGDTWVFLGDSITQDPAGYVSRCAEVLHSIHPDYDLRFVNAGIGGNKARDMVARFDGDVLSFSPNVVSISVGVNDVWHGFYDFDRGVELDEYEPRFGEALDEFRADLEWMAEQLSDMGIRTILLSPTMIGEERATRENKMLEDYVGAMREVATKWNALYCPMNESLWRELDALRKQSPGARLTTDGVHMNSWGAKAMARTLLLAIGASSK